MLADPMMVPDTSENLAQSLRRSSTSAELIGLAAGILGVPMDATAKYGSGRVVRREREIPGELRPAVEGLLQAISQAQPLVDKAFASLNEDERRAALKAVSDVVTHQESSRRARSQDYDTMMRFDRASMFAAAQLLTAAADKAVPILRAAIPAGRGMSKKRWSTPSGDVVLSGAGDDRYGPDDLKDVALLIDLGDNNHYEGPVAAAENGKIRIVIDFGKNVSIDDPGGSATAGSGIFGIGLLYLPTPEGRKIFHAQNFSLGSGVFGVGGLFVGASTAVFDAAHFSEGAGAFGLGLFSVRSSTAHYSLRMAGQGLGFSGGAGIFLHRGDGARIDGGLFYPDPRESLAGLSLVQGVGYGPRAFAAGGVGLALIDGNRTSLNASYVSQGSGYWHSFGGLFVFGDDARLQARRYDQGSGIHTAVGALVLKGNDNRTLNWGVGPAFGWDYGIGTLLVRGDENAFQADWAPGRGDFNGHALAIVHGDRNRIALPDFGSGAPSRGTASFGAAIVSGSSNRVRWAPMSRSTPTLVAGGLDLRVNPWGILHIGGSAILDPSLHIETPVWPQFDRDTEARIESEFSAQRLAASEALTPAEQIAEWLSLSASFGPGAPGERSAGGRLLSLPEDRLAQLTHQLSPDFFDEYLWLRTFAAAYGRGAIPAIKAEIAGSSGLRKALALSLLSSCPIKEAMPILEEAVKDSDWHVRRAAAGIIGGLYSRERGEEMGRRGFLETAARPRLPILHLSRHWESLLRQKRLADLYAFLALSPQFATMDRLSLFSKSPSPLDPAGTQAIGEFARLWDDSRLRMRDAARQELLDLFHLENAAHETLLGLLPDSDPAVLEAALIALGQLGRSEDGKRLTAFLSNETAALREAAASGLDKMGRSAKDGVRDSLRSKDARTRAMAAVAAARSSDTRVVKLLSQALQDPDPLVRRTALASISQLPSPIYAYGRKFRRQLQRMAQSDPDASVRLIAARAALILP